MFKNFKYLLNLFKKVDISNKPIPCMDCGACCSYFRVEFKIKENPQVPAEAITIKNNKIAAMKGAEKFKGRCEYLEGKVGEKCSCKVYEQRPNVCRAFPVWLPNGLQNPKCIAARKNFGLKGEIENN